MADAYHAIETIWAGDKFRSRLEARWAVFFHEVGIEYLYENEGFRGADLGDGEVYYLPDFYFPKYKIYAEVKGTKEALQDDAGKIGRCIDFNMTPVSNGLIILGEIPYYEQITWGNIPMFSYLYCNSGVREENAIFTGDVHRQIVTGNDAILRYMFKYNEDSGEDWSIPQNVETKCKWTNISKMSFPEYKFDGLKEAYRTARQARFEHGEAPEVKPF